MSNNRTISRRSEALNKYLADIALEPLISVDEEKKLALKVRKGGREGKWAMEKLVKSNLRFVVAVAKQYQNQGLSLDDLIDEGNAGLIKAAENFEETRGFKFITYAIWWIRQSILQAIPEPIISINEADIHPFCKNLRKEVLVCQKESGHFKELCEQIGDKLQHALSKGTNGIKQAAVLILQDAHHPILMEELDALKRNVTDKLPKDDNILWGLANWKKEAVRITIIINK